MTIIRKICVALSLLISCSAHAIESSTSKLADSKILTEGSLSDPSMAGNLIQTTLGLLVVLAVIGGAAWGFKRFGNFQSGVQGKLRVVGGISLSTRERVVLLQVGDQQLVVGVTPGHIQTLHVLDEPLPTESVTQESPSFSVKLQSAMAKHIVKKTGGSDSSAIKKNGEV